MTANRQRVGYLAVFLIAITVLPAGLVALWRYPIVGVILILSALALSIPVGGRTLPDKALGFRLEFLTELRAVLYRANRWAFVVLYYAGLRLDRGQGQKPPTTSTQAKPAPI